MKRAENKSINTKLRHIKLQTCQEFCFCLSLLFDSWLLLFFFVFLVCVRLFVLRLPEKTNKAQS